MNVNEVKKAQKIIRSAKIDLAMIVKKHLESGNPLMVNNLKPFDVSITDLFADQRVPVQIFFKDCETSLQIQVDLICRLPSDCIYIISCEELGIYNYYPGTNNDISAQGKADICYSTIGNGDLDPQPNLVEIEFRNYNR